MRQAVNTGNLQPEEPRGANQQAKQYPRLSYRRTANRRKRDFIRKNTAVVNLSSLALLSALHTIQELEYRASSSEYWQLPANGTASQWTRATVLQQHTGGQ